MITRLPKGASRGLVLLHGRGGSASDIMGLVDHTHLTEIAAAAPEAPGRSWWPTSFLAPDAQIAPYLDAGLAATTHAIDTLIRSGIPRDRIWLCGFSQGACLALEAFARNGAGLGGVLGFSGALIGLEDSGAPTPALYGHADKRLSYGPLSGDVWLSCHQSDPHIPLRRVADSATALTQAGARVQTQIYPGEGHAVMREDLAALRARLGDQATTRPPC